MPTQADLIAEAMRCLSNAIIDTGVPEFSPVAGAIPVADFADLPADPGKGAVVMAEDLGIPVYASETGFRSTSSNAPIETPDQLDATTIRPLNFVINGGGSAIAAGEKGFLGVDYNLIIDRAVLMVVSDDAGSVADCKATVWHQQLNALWAPNDLFSLEVSGGNSVIVDMHQRFDADDVWGVRIEASPTPTATIATVWMRGTVQPFLVSIVLPVISSVAAAFVNPDIVVTWTTDKRCYSQLHYSQVITDVELSGDPTVDNPATGLWTPKHNLLETSHTESILSVDTGVSYYIRAYATDRDGNVKYSAIQTVVVP